jgi:hypothetical protein
MELRRFWEARMKEETRSALKSIFDKREADQKAADEAQEKRLSEEDAFLKSFIQRREGVIKPAMQEIGEAIKERGYNYSISTEEDQHKSGSGASIRFNLLVGQRQGPESPGLAISCDKAARSVRFHENTMTAGRGGHSRSVGEVPIEQVIPDLVQQKVLALIAQVLG